MKTQRITHLAARHFRAWRAAFGIALAFGGLAPRAHGASPEVSLFVEGPTGPAVPGGGLVYKLHVANMSPTTPTPKLVVEANIPQFMAVNRPPEGKCLPKRCDSSYEARFGGTVQWNVPPLGPGAAVVHELRAVVDNSAEFPPPPDGSKVPLDVSVKSGAVKVASATSTVLMQVAPPTLSLAVVGTTRVVSGNSIDYTFRYGNGGLTPTSATLRVPLPPSTSVLLASQGAVLKGNTLEWDLGKLPAGYSDQRSVRLALDAKVASATLFPVRGELRGSPQNTAYAELVTLVGKEAPLAITTSVTPDPATSGGTVLYKIDVTNKSPNAPTGAFTVLSSIPRNVSVNRPQGAQCLPTRCDSSYKARYGANVVWKVASLAPGATTSVQFAAVVDKPVDAAPPPQGTILSSELRVDVGGLVRVPLAVAIGTTSTLGKGAALVALAPEPKKNDEKPRTKDKSEPTPAPKKAAAAAAEPAPPPQPTGGNKKPTKLSVSLTGQVDVKTK